MSQIILNNLIDMQNIAATPSSGFVVGYDIDGILKQKDQNGTITEIGKLSTPNLAQTLLYGNNTGTHSIIFGTSTSIRSSSGTGRIQLDYNNGVFISKTSSTHIGSVYINDNIVNISNINGVKYGLINLTSLTFSSYIGEENKSSQIVQDGDKFYLTYTNDYLNGSIKPLDIGLNYYAGADNSAFVHINTSNSHTLLGIKNSVIIGGNGLTSSEDNTVYLGNNVNINNEYTLPNIDGLSNQVLTTDGSGLVSWTNQSSSIGNVLSTGNDTGVNSLIMGTSTSIYSSNGLGKIELDNNNNVNISNGASSSLIIGTVSSTHTSGDLKGLVYTSDYSNTFVNNSLVSKKYVDDRVNTLGNSEDGTYTDGLFKDFIPSTPIGTAIDRFNELFLSLVPSSSPILSDWSGFRTGGVDGKLSFDSTKPITGSTYVGSPINADSSWISSGKRLSIYSSTNTQNLTGTLNNQVATSSTLPTPEFSNLSFGDGDNGNLNLYINGVLISLGSVNLTNLSSQNTTINSSGFIISSATSSKFPNGSNFDTFKNRTGTYVVKHDDPNIVLGYNFIVVEHFSSSPSFTRTLSRYEFIVDHNTDNTIFSNESIPTYTLTGSKYLSGINFFTGGNIRYNIQIDNLYRNTYYPGADAITFTDNSSVGNAGTNPILNVGAQYSLPISAGNELKSITSSTLGGSFLTFSIISNVRRLNDTIGIRTTAKRTLQGTQTSIGVTLSNIYLDNVSASSTDLIEGFDDELKRLKNNIDYNLISDIDSNTWNSTQSLSNGDSNHNNGLQVIGSKLLYPIVNFSSIGSTSSTNLNYNITSRNYSSLTGNRTYIRYFKQISPTTGNFTINISGSGGTFVPISDTSTTNWIHLELKAPGISTSETGWLDAYKDFSTNNWSDGSGGRKSSSGVGRTFGLNWGLTIGSKNTSNSGGYIIIRIKVGTGFTGNLSNISLIFG